ncbi:MAG TPA: methionine aminotransferase [Burkholderiaceae bacterium]|nr:methionine aminotransferase [Burkholderiaceae bacterium]
MTTTLPPPTVDDLEARIGPSKLPRVGTTIFTVMSQAALDHGAINLGQGFPDWDCAQRLKDLVAEAIAAGHNQYPPMAGVPALRRRIAGKQLQLYGRAYDADTEVTITAGATQAIMTAIFAVVRPGDEVIVVEPVYDSYVPSILLAGGRPVPVPLATDGAGTGYRVDWDAIERHVSSRTRLLVLNFPHNPTGITLQPDDVKRLERIVAASNLLLLSDEVYEHIVFDGAAHASLARSAILARRAMIVSSFGKTFHVTGWKVGYCCAPAALTREFRKVHQFMVFTVNTPVQHALARYLEDPTPYLDLGRLYQAKRDLFVAGLSRSRFRALPCAGTYFVIADYAAISDEAEATFAMRLTREHGVAAIPVSAFYDEPVERRRVRFCFAKGDATLSQALERLARV